MQSSPICVDASFIVRLILNPDDEELQRRWEQWIAEERQILAPHLLFFEVMNALYQYEKNDVLKREAVESAWNTVLKLPIQVYQSEYLYRKAMEYAMKFELSAAYDANYLVLAEHFQAELWTADRKLVNRVGDIFDWITLIP